MEGNVRLFLLLIPHVFRSESSYLSYGVKELGFFSVYQDHVLLFRSSLGLVDESPTPVLKFFRCRLFSTITEPWVMMLSLVLPRLLQNVSFWAFSCRYAAGFVLGVWEILNFLVLHVASYSCCWPRPWFRFSGCRQLTEVLLLVAWTTEVVGMRRILPTSLRWQSLC